MSEQKGKPKAIKPTVNEIYEQYIKDEILRKNTERLFEIAREHKMKNRCISRNSYTFTYRGNHVFNITMRGDKHYAAGFKDRELTNHLHILLCIGNKENAEKILSAFPAEIRAEYVNNTIISCKVCAGTPEGRVIRNLTCDNVLDFNESGKIHHLCTVNFGYACHNPSTEQFKIIEQMIMARINAIDLEKSKNKQ